MVSTTTLAAPSRVTNTDNERYPQRFSLWLTQIESSLVEYAAAWHTALVANPVGSPSHNANQYLAEAMSHALLGGGKRIRPLLVCLLATGFSSSATNKSTPPAVLAAASAIEMLHTYSLVHDDLPAMDNDILRRGQPTVHYKYGEAMGILVGDALQAEAFALLAEQCPNHPQLVGELAKAAGVSQLICGQWLDLSLAGKTITQEEVATIHTHKTGALFGAAMAMGGILAYQPGPVLATLRQMGHQLGSIFQIADDLLDVSATAAELGKSAGKDAGQDKNSILRYCTVNQACACAETAQQQFAESLQTLGVNSVVKEHLLWLCHFMLARRA